jgi:predicted TIM-barrel fold metal-dependent hydrolase
MGLDLPFDDTKRVVDWVRNLQIPEELREQYGYLEITSEMRAGFLGKNLARLAKIDDKKRV